jgi:hypothetical protein
LPGSPSHVFQDLYTILCCSFAVSIVKLHQARYMTPNKRMQKISTSTELKKILDTRSQDMLVLSSTVASRYYNCWIDGSTSPRNYGYPQYNT